MGAGASGLTGAFPPRASSSIRFSERVMLSRADSHAEIIAINKASKVIGDWRLEECTLYVTLEPCQMCSGAIVQARIPRVVIGCMNAKAGCAGSVLNILQMPEFNHQVEITKDVLQEPCSEMLSDFFKELRIRNKKKKMEGFRLLYSIIFCLV